MRAAVIDLGTNTFHLIIAEVSPSGVSILFKANEPVKLGESTINERIISGAAFERGIFALTEFRKIAEEYQVQIIKAIATSAVREAKNSHDFIVAAEAQALVKIEVISGDEEATYISRGVRASGAVSGTCLIMDIGGGSTEFIICNDQQLLWKKSFDIGAARLMQAYFNSDPLNEADRSVIISYLETILPELFHACDIYKPIMLIGSAGAFETYASMIDTADILKLAHADLNITEYKILSKRLQGSTHAERTEMKGLIPLRTDMIVMASLLTDLVLERAKIKCLRLSTYDLKMGVLYELADSNAH